VPQVHPSCKIFHRQPLSAHQSGRIVTTSVNRGASSLAARCAASVDFFYYCTIRIFFSRSNRASSGALLGRRQRRHPSLEVFAPAAGLTETKQARTPFADSAPDEDLRRSHPTVRPRPAQRPACDPAHCNGPCVAAVCYGPNL
jgi:hypothetical protein